LTQERSRDTRRRLVRTAMRLWTERGFESGIEDTTADEIVQAAGVTKGTFYFHFAHKEEILLELGYQTATLLYEEAARCVKAKRSIEDSLRKVTNTLATSVKAAPPAAVGRAMSEFPRSRRPGDEPLARFPSFAQAVEMLFSIVLAGLRPGAAFPSRETSLDDRAMTWGLRRTPPPNRPAATAADGDGWADADWVDVGALRDLRDNRLVVEVNGVSIVVVRAGGSIVAIEDECPHLGSRLSEGQVRGRTIRCAAHGYRWDLTTGRSLQGPRGPRRRPLREVPARQAGDRIMLAWPAPRPGPADRAPRETGLPPVQPRLWLVLTAIGLVAEPEDRCLDAVCLVRERREGGALLGEVSLVSRRRAGLRTDHRFELGGVGIETRLPGTRVRRQSGQVIETGVPARRVARGRVGRQLVDEHQARPAVLGREFEPEHLLAPGEREQVRFVDFEYLAGERDVDDFGREEKGDRGTRLPPLPGHGHVAGKPGPELLAFGQRLPHDRGWIGKVPFKPDGRSQHVIDEQFGVRHVVLRCLRCSSSRSR
jgi:nitrite reductase/ring-hydroxylating ferredoxin subunit